MTINRIIEIKIMQLNNWKIINMKRTILLSSVLLALLFTSCTHTLYIAETYIKTKIENHNEKQFSTIKTYPVFKGKSNGDEAYLDLTGYKYADSKALVLGVDKYYKSRQKFKGECAILGDIKYIELSQAQCYDIIANYRVLQEKLNAENPKAGEEVYHDFTVSKDLFISYKKSSVNSSVFYMDFWVHGEKYSIPSQQVIKKLIEFVNY